MMKNYALGFMSLHLVCCIGHFQLAKVQWTTFLEIYSIDYHISFGSDLRSPLKLVGLRAFISICIKVLEDEALHKTNKVAEDSVLQVF